MAISGEFRLRPSLSIDYCCSLRAMGTSSYNLDTICWLHESGHFSMPAAIADIGCQQLSHPTNDAVIRFARHFGGEVPAAFTHYSYMGELYRASGFDYVSLDIAEAPYVRRFDLNSDTVCAELRERFDIVVNSGTTEHVLNQLNAFKTVHDLAKPGGLIYCMFLVNGFGPHGLLLYCERFADLLASANGYEVILRERHERTFSQARAASGGSADPEHFVADQCDWVVFKKKAGGPFQVVLDL